MILKSSFHHYLPGRLYEYMGEDPHLTSKLAQAYIQGVQGQGLMACVKHFVDNSFEYNRSTVSANVPQRAQWELYYPAFQAAIAVSIHSYILYSILLVYSYMKCVKVIVVLSGGVYGGC